MAAAQIPEGWVFSASIPSWTQTTLEGDELVVFYRVEVKVLPPDKNGAPRCRSVLRRFSHFKKLHGRLVEELGSARMQGLAPPRKGGIFATVNKQPALIERRRRELQEWLYALIRDPAIAHSRMLNNFLELADAARFVQRSLQVSSSTTGSVRAPESLAGSYALSEGSSPRAAETSSVASVLTTQASDFAAALEASAVRREGSEPLPTLASHLANARRTSDNVHSRSARSSAAGGADREGEGALATSANAMRIGLHVEQRGSLKKHVRELQGRLDRASSDLQDAVEVIAAEREGKRSLALQVAALEARVNADSGNRSSELDRLLSQVTELNTLAPGQSPLSAALSSMPSTAADSPLSQHRSEMSHHPQLETSRHPRAGPSDAAHRELYRRIEQLQAQLAHAEARITSASSPTQPPAQQGEAGRAAAAQADTLQQQLSDAEARMAKQQADHARLTSEVRQQAEGYKQELSLATAQLGALAKDGDTLAGLRAELEQQQEAAQKQLAHSEQLQAQLASASQQLAELQAATAGTDQLAGEAEAERKRLQQELEAAGAQKAAGDAKLLADMKVLAKEIKQLRRQLAAEKDANAQLTLSNDERAQAAEMEAAAQLQAAKAAAGELASALKLAEARAAQAETAQQQLSERASTAEDALAKQSDSASQLEARAQQAETALSSEQQLTCQLQTALAEAHARVQSGEAALAAQSEAASHLEAAQTAAASHHGEVFQLQGALAEAQSEVQSAQAALAAQQASASELAARLEARAQQAESDAAAQLARVTAAEALLASQSDLTEQLKLAVAEHAAGAKAAEAARGESVTQLAEASAQLHTAQAAAAGTQDERAAALQEQVANLAARLQQAEAAAHAAERSLTEAQSSSAEQLSEAESRAREAERRAHEAEAARLQLSADVTATAEKLQLAAGEYQTLQLQLEQATSALQSSQHSAAASATEAARKLSAAEALVQELTKAGQQGELAAQLQEAQASLEAAHAQSGHLTGQLRAAQVSATKQEAQLLQQRAQASERAQQADASAAQLSARLQKAEASQAAAEGRAADLQAKLTASQSPVATHSSPRLQTTLQEVETMRSRMHEAIAQALAPQGGPGNTLAALDTSDNRLQLLVAEAQLMTQPPTHMLNLMDDLPSANGASPTDRPPDPQEAALRQAFADLLIDSGNLWQQANRVIRSLHHQQLKAGPTPVSRPPAVTSNGGPMPTQPAADLLTSNVRSSAAPPTASPQLQSGAPQLRPAGPRPVQGQFRTAIAAQQARPQLAGAGLGLPNADSAARFFGKFMGASTAQQPERGSPHSQSRPEAASAAAAGKPVEAAANSGATRSGAFLAGGMDRFANLTRSFTQRDAPPGSGTQGQ